MKKLSHRNNFGFTLIELLLVISIISLLSSVVISSVQDARTRAKMTNVKQAGLELQKAIELYRTDYGKYPGPFSPSYGSTANNAPLLNSNFIQQELGQYLPGWSFPEQNIELLTEASGGVTRKAVYYALKNNWGNPPNCGSSGVGGPLEYVVYFMPKNPTEAAKYFKTLYLGATQYGAYFCLFVPVK